MAALRDVLECISPIPKSKTVRQRKRAVEHAEVLTSSPYKKRLLEKQTLQKSTAKSKARPAAKQSKDSKAVIAAENTVQVTACSKINPGAKNKTRRAAAKPRKLKCRMDKGRKPNRFPPAVSLKNQAAEQPCSVCGIVENSKEDLAFAQDWIQCNTCKGWSHELCGETGGILDDDYFTCAQCV